MKVAVISDLHLGAADSADLFGHDDYDFLKFLRALEGNFEKIVLLGDIWETLTNPVPWTPRAALEMARRAHPEIAKRFAGPRYQYVHGNHDIITAWDGVPDHYELNVDGLRLHFTHGHMYDLLIRRARWLSELGVCFGAWLRRVGWGPLYRFFEVLDQMATAADVDPKSCAFQGWALAYAKRMQADIIITGHTHVATRSEHTNQLFLNSGTCSYGRYSFLALDTKRGDYQVCSQW
ncbi:MAG: hypothetical protein RJA70_3766 [Pseudomonadota bacterium]|jgi:predicted phosphodiesterase